jgi:TPR repeat protein
MKKYYLMAIDKGSIVAMYNLANWYNAIENYKLMIKYYLMAINKGCIKSMYNLGCYYNNINDINNMIKYYSMAIDNNIEDNKEKIIIILANYYEDIGKYKIAKKYYYML